MDLPAGGVSALRGDAAPRAGARLVGYAPCRERLTQEGGKKLTLTLRMLPTIPWPSLVLLALASLELASLVQVSLVQRVRLVCLARACASVDRWA